MPLLKVLKVGGVNYPLVIAPHRLVGIPYEGAIVDVNGTDKPAFRHTQNGNWTFKAPVAVTNGDVEV